MPWLGLVNSAAVARIQPTAMPPRGRDFARQIRWQRDASDEGEPPESVHTPASGLRPIALGMAKSGRRIGMNAGSAIGATQAKPDNRPVPPVASGPVSNTTRQSYLQACRGEVRAQRRCGAGQAPGRAGYQHVFLQASTRPKHCQGLAGVCRCCRCATAAGGSGSASDRLLIPFQQHRHQQGQQETISAARSTGHRRTAPGQAQRRHHCLHVDMQPRSARPAQAAGTAACCGSLATLADRACWFASSAWTTAGACPWSTSISRTFNSRCCSRPRSRRNRIEPGRFGLLHHRSRPAQAPARNALAPGVPDRVAGEAASRPHGRGRAPRTDGARTRKHPSVMAKLPSLGRSWPPSRHRAR